MFADRHSVRVGRLIDRASSQRALGTPVSLVASYNIYLGSGWCESGREQSAGAAAGRPQLLVCFFLFVLFSLNVY